MTPDSKYLSVFKNWITSSGNIYALKKRYLIEFYIKSINFHQTVTNLSVSYDKG